MACPRSNLRSRRRRTRRKRSAARAIQATTGSSAVQATTKRANPSGQRTRRVSPTQVIGVSGAAIYGGYLQTREKAPELASHDARYRTYADILSNTSIVAAGVQYYLGLIGGAAWSFAPAEADTDGFYAELAEAMLMEDPAKSWARTVRAQAMHRFYGFSIMEWTAGRRDDGLITLRRLDRRPQVTIERWDTDATRDVAGVWQQSPQTYQDIYLPRQKLWYLVTDSLDDSPEGYGLLRQLVAPAKRLARYEQLEGFGYEMDLHGVPIVRAPIDELQAVDGATDESVEKATAPVREFAQHHIKNPELALVLPSATYKTLDEAERPSNIYKWSVEVLQSSATSFAPNAAAIERLNREAARIIGVEQLLLGSDGGSYALRKDKTHQFDLLVDGSLTEIREGAEKDLLPTLWRLNGWPREMMPTIKTETVSYTDVEQAAAALRDLAVAGAPLMAEDPAYLEMLDLLGLSRPDAGALDGRGASDPEGDDPDADPDGLGSDPEGDDA